MLLLFLTGKHDSCFIPQLGQHLQSSKTPDLKPEDKDIQSNTWIPMLRVERLYSLYTKVIKGAKIRNRYNQVPHLTQDTNGKVTNSQSDTTNESQEVSPFPAGDHKTHINRCAQRHSKDKTERYNKEINQG